MEIKPTLSQLIKISKENNKYKIILEILDICKGGMVSYDDCTLYQSNKLRLKFSCDIEFPDDLYNDVLEDFMKEKYNHIETKVTALWKEHERRERDKRDRVISVRK